MVIRHQDVEIEVWPLTWPSFMQYTGHTTVEGAKRTALLMRDAGDLVCNERPDGVRLTRRCRLPDGTKRDLIRIRADRASTPAELRYLARERREAVLTHHG
jgi:hypothetical protein